MELINKKKVVIIIKANRELIIKKLQPKWKIKCLYYFKTLIKLIKPFNSKKEFKGNIFSIL